MINLIITLLFIVSLLLGSVISNFLNTFAIKLISFFILFCLALTKIFEYSIKKLCSTLTDKEFKIFDFTFILKIVNDNTLADKDHSKILSPKEGIPLAIALSLDGICAALSIGMYSIDYYKITFFSFCITFIMFIAGNVLGKGFFAKRKMDLSWISVLILLCLAFSKLM